MNRAKLKKQIMICASIKRKKYASKMFILTITMKQSKTLFLDRFYRLCSNVESTVVLLLLYWQYPGR